MAQGWREPVLRAARRRGLEPHLRTVQRALMNGEQRRNARDDAHLRRWISMSLAEDANAIDIGANVGDILGQIVAIAPKGRHIAFEPLPELAADLARRYPDVDVRAAAVSDVPGARSFTRVIDAHSRSGFHEAGYAGATSTFEIDVQVIDQVVDPGATIDLIKIDVEGAELQVLQGARATLRRCRPTVALEHGGPADVSRALHALLCDETGLRLFDMEGAGPFSLGEFLAVIDDGSRWNFLAHR